MRGPEGRRLAEQNNDTMKDPATPDSRLSFHSPSIVTCEKSLGAVCLRRDRSTSPSSPSRFASRITPCVREYGVRWGASVVGEGLEGEGVDVDEAHVESAAKRSASERRICGSAVMSERGAREFKVAVLCCARARLRFARLRVGAKILEKEAALSTRALSEAVQLAKARQSVQSSESSQDLVCRWVFRISGPKSSQCIAKWIYTVDSKLHRDV